MLAGVWLRTSLTENSADVRKAAAHLLYYFTLKLASSLQILRRLEAEGTPRIHINTKDGTNLPENLLSNPPKQFKQ